MIKKVLKKIMDLKTVRGSTPKKTAKNVDNTLSEKEVEFLLQLIASSTFEGKDVQIVYETAVKLQQQLLKKDK